MIDLYQCTPQHQWLTVELRVRQDSMIGIRDNNTAGQECRRWRVLRWLIVPLVLVALGLAGASMAEAHPVQHAAAHGPFGMMSDIAHDGQKCCNEAEAEHTADACSSLGHCVVCALGNAAVSVPALSPRACVGLRMTTLPVGHDSGPARHPPKASRQV